MADIQANVMDIREFVNIQVIKHFSGEIHKCMIYCSFVQAQYENSAVAALDRCKEFLSSGKFSMVRQVLCCTVLYFTVLYCTGVAGRRVRLHGGAPRQAGPVPTRPRAAPGKAVTIVALIEVSTLERETNLREV